MVPASPCEPRPTRWLAFLCLLVPLSLGCGAPPPPSNTQDSPRALLREVLTALERRDRARLDALAVTEQEFRDHVWDRLPASRPERNLPMSYVWSDLHQKSVGSLARTLGEHGGQRLELVAVEFDEEPRSYGPFSVHGGTHIRVRTAAGSEEDVRVCGSLLEMNGRWKVFSYVVDD